MNYVKTLFYEFKDFDTQQGDKLTDILPLNFAR